ncbi:conserved Plasmodium protein, unknown function [Plasmodium malariae]|uniref:Nucleoplasmin-like domain-containing protein n=1 Tax=Plasmodium malariae TaxID=5858 RepID=A0A1D3TEK0_PLAMA|nr:conserved Plasmodium protein, unknown function [Plasmodium malariae]SCP03372.1 conserved Plasmodium protein, unknown function [Plasmodium malariae]
MFYGKVIKADETVVPEIKDGYSVIHLSRACLNNPQDEGKLYVQVEDANGCYNICCLQKNVCEDTALDIFLMLENDVKIKTSGSANEVHIVGYYEVSFGQDNLDEDEEEFEEDDEYENEEVRMLTKKNTLKNSLSNGLNKKKKDTAADEDDETNVGKNDDEEDEEDDDDDEDDEDEDDDEEDDEEDDDEEGEEEDEEEDEEGDEDEDEEEGDEDEEEEEGDEDEEDAGTKNKGDKKEKGQKKNKNKRSLDNKNDAPSKKTKLGDESQFEKDLVAFLKKNGKTKLTELGKVKKPEGLKVKLGFFIKKRSGVFKFDNDSQTVSLK